MRRIMAVLALAVAVALPQAAAAAVAAVYPVGHQPFGVVIDPADGRVYVSNSGGTTVSVVDPSAGTVRSVAVGNQPGALALDSAGHRLYVSNFVDQTLTVVDTGTLTQVTTVFDAGGLGIAVDPAVHRLYAPRGTEFEAVSTLNFSVVSTIGVGGGGNWWGAAVDPTRHEVYVTNMNATAPSLVILDQVTLGVLAQVALPKPVRFALALDAARGYLYLGSDDPSSDLYVVDLATRTVVQTTPLGGLSAGIALAPAKHRVYVTDSVGQRVVEVDDQTFAVTGSTSLPWTPELLALHPDGRLYVAGFSADVLGAVVVGNNPPVIDATSIAPLSPRTNDVLQASVLAHDPDGDALSYTYEWSRNGTVIAGATGSTLDLSVPGNGDRNDIVSVLVTVSDGIATDTDTASVTVADTAPTASVVLDKTAPTTNDVVTATTTGADVDGDSLSYSFTWKVNGLVRRTTSGPNASDTFDLGVAGNGDRGDTLVVEAVVSDGTLGSAVATATAVVANTAPTVSVRLSDSTPQKKDVLVATASGRDADGDPLTFTYTWRVDGDVVQTTNTNDSSDSLIVRDVASNFDLITVTVVAKDPFASSPPATASATVTPGGGFNGDTR